MKKYLLYATSLLLVFALVACSTETTTKKSKKKSKKDKETVEETVETEDTDTTEPEITEETETEITTETSSSSNVIISDTCEYIDISNCTTSDYVTLNDDTYSIYTYLNYVYGVDYDYDKLIDRLWDIYDGVDAEITGFTETQTDKSAYADKSRYYYSYMSVDYKLTRSDTMAVSFYTVKEQYISESNESIRNAKSYNIDPNTGDDIPLSSIISMEGEFKGWIENDLWFEEDALPGFEDLIESMELDDFTWVLTSKGIKVIFDPGVVLPEERGFYTVDFDLGYLEPAIKLDFWSDYPANRVTEFYNGDYLDYIYSEGNYSYTIDYLRDEYDYLNGISITTEESSLKYSDFWGFSHKAYLVESNGSKYIYISVSMENDYNAYYIFDVTDSSDMTYVATISGEITNFINPDSIVITRRIQKLSTVNGYAEAFINSEGIIELKDDMYFLTNSHEFNVVKDITGGAGADFGDTYTVKAGTTLYYIATDDESYVIMTDGDNYIRFTSESYDDIDGQSIYDVFDTEDIQFAG